MRWLEAIMDGAKGVYMACAITLSPTPVEVRVWVDLYQGEELVYVQESCVLS